MNCESLSTTFESEEHWMKHANKLNHTSNTEVLEPVCSSPFHKIVGPLRYMALLMMDSMQNTYNLIQETQCLNTNLKVTRHRNYCLTLHRNRVSFRIVAMSS